MVKLRRRSTDNASDEQVFVALMVLLWFIALGSIVALLYEWLT